MRCSRALTASQQIRGLLLIQLLAGLTNVNLLHDHHPKILKMPNDCVLQLSPWEMSNG